MVNQTLTIINIKNAEIRKIRPTIHSCSTTLITSSQKYYYFHFKLSLAVSYIKYRCGYTLNEYKLTTYQHQYSNTLSIRLIY